MKRITPLVAGLLALAFGLTPLVLHFGQKRHDALVIELPENPEAEPRGAVFALSLAALMEHELDGFTGWRPNDLPPWGPWLGPDNNASRQLGILQAIRETTRVMKDHLTKVSSDVYDPNLLAADNLFRNDPEKWAFPSAEGRYREAVAKLRAYVDGLHAEPPTSRPINVRNVELMRLIQAWTDLLGGAHAALYRREIGWFQIDDVFYRATGTCHVILHMGRAVEIEYARELKNKPVLAQLFEEIRAPLEHCARMKPLLVLNGSDTSLLANHRRNLDASVTEVRQKLYSIREELEK